MIRTTAISFLFFCATFPAVLACNGQSTKKILRTIVIDPGHGGIDGGAKGDYSTEASIALAVSMKLGQALQEELPETKIVYTRTTDVLPGDKNNITDALRYRADLANSSGGDLFIAVHCNAAPPIRHSQVVGYKTVTVKRKKKKITKKVPQYRYWTTPNPAAGTETYIWALSKSDDKVNSVSKNDDYGEVDSTSSLTLPDPSDPAERARMLIYAQNYFRKSLAFADLIEKGFQAQGRTYRGGVKQRNDKGIWVLQATGMPSVLIELGFVTSKSEEDYLNSDKGQDEMVNNIVSAVKDYKQKLESRQLTGDKKAF